MLNLVHKLSGSPLFNISLSSKELFHSNFLYWLAKTYPSEFGEQFSERYLEAIADLDRDKVYREKNNIDLSFQYSNGVEVALENKVKSIPYKSQLDKYTGDNSKVYILLSLSEPIFFEGQKTLDINGAKWHYLNYQELCKMLENIVSKVSEQYHKSMLQDYLLLINALIEINQVCSVSETDIFDFHSISKDNTYSLLKDIRLHDFYLKKKYEQLAYLLYNELKGLNKNVIEFGQDLDWNSGNEEIYVGFNMTRSLGLMDIKYKIAENLVLGIQIQGESYRLVVEDSNSRIAQNIKDELASSFWFKFDAFPTKEVYPKNGKGFNKFGDNFFYKSVKLGTELSIRDIIDIVISDVKLIEQNITEAKLLV